MNSVMYSISMHRLLAPEKAKELREKANAILADYSQISDPLERMLSIAKDHGITILQSDLYEMSGALRKEGVKWVIYVNKNDSKQRQLFTIAHELGHFFAHKDMCDEFVDGQLVSRAEQEKYAIQELEANEFAGNLVMPEHKIREALHHGQLTEQKVLELARQFQVSSLAMATRLRNLDYDVPGFNSKTA